MKILADATLPGLDHAFPKPFEITLYKQNEEIPRLLKGQQILLCRSTLKVNKALLKGHPLRYVATASSGTDHIDALCLRNNSIGLIDAKGSNAIAVADYVIATLAFLQKYKGFSGTKVGVIGVGEVGSRVVERLKTVNMDVLSYDPLKSELDSHFCHSSLEAIKQCDLISVHANLHDDLPYPSRDLLNAAVLRELKSGTVLLNASRGGIINEKALLNQKNSLLYCTDVYSNEPSINPKIIEFATLCTPHIAGHSIEAKYQAVAMISQKLHACLKLTPPNLNFSPPEKQTILSSEQKNWQDLVLSLYNPMHETNRLKAAEDLTLTFLNLRQAHYRHHFCNYESH